METGRDSAKPAVPGLKRTDEFKSLKKTHVPPKKESLSRPLGVPRPNIPSRSTPIKRKPVISGSTRPMPALEPAQVQKAASSSNLSRKPDSIMAWPAVSHNEGQFTVALAGSNGRYKRSIIGNDSARIQDIDHIVYKLIQDSVAMQVVVKNVVWRQFKVDFKHSVELRAMCQGAGISLARVGSGRPSAAPKEDSVDLSHPLEVTCCECDPEPTKGRISGRRVHLMMNDKGVHFDGKFRDEGTFFRKFDFLETSVHFSRHCGEFSSENGSLELKLDGARFIVEFDSRSHWVAVRKKLTEKYERAFAPHSERRSAAEQAALRRTDPALSAQSPLKLDQSGLRKHNASDDQKDANFDAISPENFYSSPGHVGSRQPRMISSPKEDTANNSSSSGDPKLKRGFAPNPAAALKRRKVSDTPSSNTDSLGSPTRSNKDTAMIDSSSSPVKRPAPAEIDLSSSPAASPQKRNPRDHKSTELGNSENKATNDTEVVKTNEKPSKQQPRRTRQRANLAEDDNEAKVEPSTGDIEELERKGFKASSYRFWDGKSVRVNLEDIARSNPEIYLNDNIIWFYSKLFMERLVEKDPARADNVLLLDTFFYYSMRSIGKDEAVPSWAAKSPFDKKPVVFLPIHEFSHWSLAIIVGLDRAIADRAPSEANESDVEPRQVSHPTIIILDSLGLSRTYNTMRKVITALGVASKAQKRPALTFKEYRSSKIDIPTQDNLTDCGSFSLHYVEQILGQFGHFLTRIMETDERNMAFGPDFWKTDKLHNKRSELQKESYNFAQSQSNQLSAIGDGAGNTAAVANESDDIIEVVEEEDRRTRRKRAAVEKPATPSKPVKVTSKPLPEPANAPVTPAKQMSEQRLETITPKHSEEPTPAVFLEQHSYKGKTTTSPTARRTENIVRAEDSQPLFSSSQTSAGSQSAANPQPALVSSQSYAASSSSQALASKPPSASNYPALVSSQPIDVNAAMAHSVAVETHPSAQEKRDSIDSVSESELSTPNEPHIGELSSTKS